MTELGRFFFRTRNLLFPLLVLAIYALERPPARPLWLDVLALALIVLGVSIRVMVIGFIRVRRDGEGKTAHADTLFTRGMFGLCRNPLYTGNILTYAGVFLLHGSWLVFFLGTGVFVFIYYAIIFSEEAYLAGKFGPEWEAYRSRVPRLLPNPANWRQATDGMEFDLRRAIIGEHNVILQALVIVALALWYKSWALSGAAIPPLITPALLLIAVAFLIFVQSQRKRA